MVTYEPALRQALYAGMTRNGNSRRVVAIYSEPNATGASVLLDAIDPNYLPEWARILPSLPSLTITPKQYRDLSALLLASTGRLDMTHSLDALDDRDSAILAERLASLPTDAPSVGEWVRFADGTMRRVSHVWPGDWHDDGIARVQTSDGGSYYLGDGYVSMSGSLYPGVKADTLTLADDAPRAGSCWFFHHDHHCASNGVDVTVPWRVWRCALVPVDGGYRYRASDAFPEYAHLSDTEALAA